MWVLEVGPEIFYVGFGSRPKIFMQVLEVDPRLIGRLTLGPYMWLRPCVFMHKCKSMIDDKIYKARIQGRNHTTNLYGLAICSQSLSTLVFGSLLDVGFTSFLFLKHQESRIKSPYTFNKKEKT